MSLLKLSYRTFAEVEGGFGNRVDLTICVASEWNEDGAGYAPAESINVKMSKKDALAFAAAITESATLTAKEVA